MTEDRKAKYLEKKSVLISYRLIKSDAEALMKLALDGETSISKIARRVTMEQIDEGKDK